MFLPKRPKKTTKKHTVTPKHHRGQNFLIDKNIVKKIVASANLSPTDVVIEVGPGQGALTRELAPHCKQLIAVEVDRDLIPILDRELVEFSNITLIHGDIRRLSIEEILQKADLRSDTSYKVVANIPYYLTSNLIRTFLENIPRPQSLTLLIQREVAERITDKNQNSILSLSVEYFAKASILFTVSKTCFRPVPKVESAVIQITPKSEKEIGSKKEQDYFFKILHAGFSAKRKYLASNLAKGLDIKSEIINKHLEKIGIDLKSRAEELDLKKWIWLVEELQKAKTP